MLTKRICQTALCCIFALGCGKSDPTSDLQAVVEQEVASQKGQVPRVIQPGITCRDVMLGKDMVICTIEVADAVTKQLADDRKPITSLASDQLRRDKDLRRLERLGVRLHYKFFDRKKKFLSDVTIGSRRRAEL